MQIADSHNDVFYKFKTYENIKNYLINVEKQGVVSLFCAYFSYNNQKDVSVRKIINRFEFIRNISDIAIPTIENAWFLTPKNIDAIIEAHPFCVTLSHNVNTYLCGGAKDDGHFTEWGKKVVKELENANIIIDTAHMNRKSFYEFVDMTTKPIFNSHTAFDTFCKHPRNLTDKQIELIVQSKGYIGLALFPEFWSTDNSLTSQEVIYAIKWFLEKFGENTLGWGTDFNGIAYYPEDIKDYSELSIVGDKLLQSGVSIDCVKNFMSNNLLKLVKP